MKTDIDKSISRRSFFLFGLGSFIVSCLAVVGGLINFLFPKVLFEAKKIFIVGFPEDYPPGTVSTKMKDKQLVWIIHSEKGIYALEAKCTHLGCTPNWFPDERLFKCPCHGSNFNIDGDVVAGPAPEPLNKVKITLNRFNKIVINKGIQENRPGQRDEAPFILNV